MKQMITGSILLIIALMFTVSTRAETSVVNKINYDRAKFNYQMLCQGCHTPDGTGGKDTPKMKDHIGYFLSTQEGREYIVRVPGSANAAIDSTQLAEVLNWIIIEMGGPSIPEKMQAYTATEVAELRKNPLFEVTEYRKQLLAQLTVNQASR